MVLMDVTQLPTRFNKKITGIDIPVVFNDQILSTVFLEGALGCLESHKGEEKGFEPTDWSRGLSKMKTLQPMIEEAAKKISIAFGSDRKRTN
jgi:hypothetical protein